MFTLFIVLFFAAFFYQWIWEPTCTNRAIMSLNEKWLAEGRSYAVYQQAFPQQCANGNTACNQCGSFHTKMFVQGSSYEASRPVALGVHFFSGWVRYRSHICGRCSVELYRSKGV